MKELLIVLIILAILIPIMATDDNTTVIITGIKGRVERKIEKSVFFDLLKVAHWQQLKGDDILMVGDMIRTGTDSSLEISFPDDIYVKIGQQTNIIIGQRSITERSQACVLELTAGQIWARVSETWQKLTQFEVITPSAVAGVRGTLFSVAVINQKTIVTVKEGKVEVRDAANTTWKLIGRNEMGIVEGKVIEHKTITKDERILWEERTVKDWLEKTDRDGQEREHSVEESGENKLNNHVTEVEDDYAEDGNIDQDNQDEADENDEADNNENDEADNNEDNEVQDSDDEDDDDDDDQDDDRDDEDSDDDDEDDDENSGE